MDGIEFYMFGSELWVKYDDGRNEVMDETKTELIDFIINKVRDCYPSSYKALESIYSKSSLNKNYYQWLIVRRFCKCNFCRLDNTAYDVENISKDGKFNFERVECPMRGECQWEGIICMPKFNTKLSPAEKRVMKLYYEGKDKNEIAEHLFLSPETIKNHIKNSYLKLGIHEKSEFIRYAKDHDIF